MTPTPISICIIAKNEEKHMEAFLSSIQKHMKDYPHEIVVADTGSTDRTASIARKYTDKVFSFAWINDFSAARNFSIGCASHAISAGSRRALAAESLRDERNGQCLYGSGGTLL